MTQKYRYPTFLESISTVLVMIVVVVIGFVFFNVPIQILLLISSAYTALIARRVGLKWKDLEGGTTHRLSTTMPAIFIILAVGITVGSWVYSGTAPALIYYGLKFLNPSYLLISTFIINAMTSIATGAAWGSASIAGIVLVSIANQLGVPAGVAVGTIIMETVFGDKMPPLSDTTSLAAPITKVNIFAHIKSMMWIIIPASIIGLAIWFIVGLRYKGDTDTQRIQSLLKELTTIYNLDFWVWIPLIIIVLCLMSRISTVPSILISSTSALVIRAFDHQFNMKDGFKTSFDEFNHTMLHQSHISDNAKALVEQDDMMSMTQIIVTMFCGYAFAGIVGKTGCLGVILETIAKDIESVGALILITTVCSIILVFAAGVASIVIITVGVLMRDMFEKTNVSKSVLSRTFEGSSTVVLPLISWGTSGIYYAHQLSVSVDQFFIWAIPCYLCAFIAIIYGFTGIGIKEISRR